MAERYVSNATSEIEFVKKHVAALGSAGGVSYNRDFALSPEERERKVPVVQVPVVKPPEPLSIETASSTEASSSSADAHAITTNTAKTASQPASSNSITLTIKSLKPPLSFSLPCSVTADVGSLKTQLYAAHSSKGAPEPERQRWLFKGKAMADERILKEYDGIKDGETVHLSIKAAPAGSASIATGTAGAQVNPPPITTLSSSSSSTSEFAAPAPPKDMLSATSASPSPFQFQSQAMSPTSSSSAASPTAASKRRARTSSQLSSTTNHSRVPSITLTTDISNFNNLAGNASSPIDGNVNPGIPMAGTPELSSAGITSPPFSPAQGGGGTSGASTPRSAPGTPYSGGRAKSPSISIPIDLDNLDLMNPLSSDRKLPVGISTTLSKTIRDPSTWSDLLDFLESKIVASAAAAAAEAKAAGEAPPTPTTPRPAQKDYSEDTIQVFENWLGASKDWMNASDIARIRDSTGVFGMGGR